MRTASLMTTSAGALAFAFVTGASSIASAQPDENELTAAPGPAPSLGGGPVAADKPADAAPTAPVGVTATVSNSLIVRGTSGQSTLLTVVSGTYDVSSVVTAFGRVGMMHNTSGDAETKTGFGNPMGGLILNLPSSEHVKLGGITGLSVPVGSGGGDGPSAGMMRAWTNSTDWGGVMFAVNHLDLHAGLNATFVAGPLALRIESTFHELLRVRGASADPYGKSLTVSSSMATVSYSVLPMLTVLGALSETRYWNTPKAIEDSPQSRRDYFGVGGVSTAFNVRKVAVSPALLYARALDLPLRTDRFQVVELDLGFAL